MSILGAESYAAVRHPVTDVEMLSSEERNHVLWYACDGGDLSMVKSVIRAGCDVDHFHRGHTPLMMASIRGHDDVVKELILAGCKVDLRSSKCSVGWFRFITKMASAWPDMLVWAVATTLFLIMTHNALVQMMCYWLLVLTVALHFHAENSFKVSGMVRMRAKIKYKAWTGIVLATVLIWRVLGTVIDNRCEPNRNDLVQAPVLVALTGVWIVTVVKETAETVAGTVVVTVVVVMAGIGIWAGGWTGALTALVVADTLLVAVVVAGLWIWFEPRTERTLVIQDALQPDAGEKVMVNGILVLAMIVTMAYAGKVHLTLAITMTVVVIVSGVEGLALGDAFVKSFMVPCFRR